MEVGRQRKCQESKMVLTKEKRPAVLTDLETETEE